MTIRRLATRLAAFAPLVFGLLAPLAGCDGPQHTPPPIPVTITTSDVSGTYARGQDVTFTFIVTNTSNGALPGTSMSYSDSGAGTYTAAVRTKSIACVAKTGTCPSLDQNGFFTNVSLPANAVLTITIVSTVQVDLDGPIDMNFSAFSGYATGTTQADSHVTLADSRDGYYVLFGTSGRVANVTVSFKPSNLHWWVSSDDTPMPFSLDGGGYVFANGSRVASGPDLLHGTYDFGAGPEAFVAVRQFESDLAALDGATFTLFSATPSGTGPRAVAVQPAWIAGSTLTLCQDTVPRTAATCPTTAQAHYAITQDGVTFIATGADTFRFFVADTGTSRVLLRGDGNGTEGFFAIGLPPAAPPTTLPLFLGTTLGAWTSISIDSTSYLPYAFQPSINSFGPPGPAVALQNVAGGPTGLRQGTRSDGVSFETASSSALTVQTGAPGQIDLFGFVSP